MNSNKQKSHFEEILEELDYFHERTKNIEKTAKLAVKKEKKR